MPKDLHRTIAEALTKSATMLSQRVRHPRRDANLLLTHVLGRDLTFIISHTESGLSTTDLDSLYTLVARRAAGEPLQYITGHQEFFKLGFEVTPDVLIPRPETELIVEVGLEVLKHEPEPYVADVGTGSGCIAISLLHELSRARGVATDLSPAALALAQRNAERHQVIDRLQLIESDLFSAIGAAESFHAIFSNPPYVPEKDMAGLQREVKHEPRSALEGGTDGLSIIRRLLDEAPQFLRRGGYFVFEIGFDQSETVMELIDQHKWKLLEIRKDFQQIPRTVVLQRK